MPSKRTHRVHRGVGRSWIEQRLPPRADSLGPRPTRSRWSQGNGHDLLTVLLKTASIVAIEILGEREHGDVMARTQLSNEIELTRLAARCRRREQCSQPENAHAVLPPALPTIVFPASCGAAVSPTQLHSPVESRGERACCAMLSAAGPPLNVALWNVLAEADLLRQPSCSPVGKPRVYIKLAQYNEAHEYADSPLRGAQRLTKRDELIRPTPLLRLKHSISPFATECQPTPHLSRV